MIRNLFRRRPLASPISQGDAEQKPTRDPPEPYPRYVDAAALLTARRHSEAASPASAPYALRLSDTHDGLAAMSRSVSHKPRIAANSVGLLGPADQPTHEE